MAAPGNVSIRKLADALRDRFVDSVLDLDVINDEQDAIGWRLRQCPQLIFSVSTNGGRLADETYDLQVSILDDSLNNGDILFGPESPNLRLDHVCAVVADFAIHTLPRDLQCNGPANDSNLRK